MDKATFAEYEAAKFEIIGGVEYKEETQFPNQWGMMSKQYHTAENGNFYESMDPNTGIVEFWSDKHPESRYYQDYVCKKDTAPEEKMTAEPQPEAAQEDKPESITFCEMNKRSGGCEECPNRYVCKDSTIQAEEPQPAAEPEPQPEYGSKLAEEIRTNTDDFSKLSDYEKFILDRGFEFKTEEELKAGYDRAWKCGHGVLLTEAEFVIEAGKYYEVETLKKVYAALVGMVEQKKMRASEIYTYARFKWCLRNPEAIVAYQRERDEWEVNNCGTEVSEDDAKEAINSEWGFEKDRVQIIGTPYYDATDWQFIRFDCGHMTWLWKNGNLYQVYAD
ncbi:hypothetical protein ACG0Z4_20855 [Enterocloster aldenensis]|uniref:hypothetical protein n=1 Tax=Enterocloster aldenensis TaxID=358742 RepID=UPI004027B9F8